MCGYEKIRDSYYPFKIAGEARFFRLLIWIPTDSQRDTNDEKGDQNRD